MSASIFSVQLGLRYNWRISTLKVLHAGNLLCAGVFIMRAGFRSPLLRSMYMKYRMIMRIISKHCLFFFVLVCFFHLDPGLKGKAGTAVT